MRDLLVLALTLATAALIAAAVVQGVRMRRRSRTAWGWLGAALLLVGLVGPRLGPSGLDRFSGDARRHAELALAHAAASLSSPPGPHLLGGPLRVAALQPLPPETTDHLGTGPCAYEVVLRSYGPFWIPARTVRARCGTLQVQP